MKYRTCLGSLTCFLPCFDRSLCSSFPPMFRDYAVAGVPQAEGFVRQLLCRHFQRRCAYPSGGCTFLYSPLSKCPTLTSAAIFSIVRAFRFVRGPMFAMWLSEFGSLAVRLASLLLLIPARVRVQIGGSFEAVERSPLLCIRHAVLYELYRLACAHACLLPPVVAFLDCSTTMPVSCGCHLPLSCIVCSINSSVAFRLVSARNVTSLGPPPVGGFRLSCLVAYLDYLFYLRLRDKRP